MHSRFFAPVVGRLFRFAALLALLVAVLVAPQGTAAAGWTTRDLTALAGAPTHYGHQSYFSPAGYTAVTFFDDYGNIYEIRENAWTTALVNLTDKVDAPPGRYPYGYVPVDRGAGVSGAVIFAGIYDGHIHEILHRTSGYSRQDLTAAAGAPKASIFSQPRGFVRAFDNRSVVYYIDEAGRVIELVREAGVWRWYDLGHQAGGAPKATLESDLDAYERADGGWGVVYISTTGGVHELSYWGDWWYTNLTAQAVGAAPAHKRLDAYVDGSGFSAVAYVGQDGRVHDLWQGGAVWNAWYHHDVTTLAGAPKADRDRSIAAYARAGGVTVIAYSDAGWTLRELAWGPQPYWVHRTLGLPNGIGLQPITYSSGVTNLVYTSYPDRHIRKAMPQ